MKLRETMRRWYGRHPKISTIIVLCLWLAAFLTAFWSIWVMLPALVVCILATVIFRGVIPAIRPRAHGREVRVKKKPKEKKIIKLVN